MNDKRPPFDSGNGQAPDPHAHDADLTAFALEQLTAEEYDIIKERLRDDPHAAKSVDEIRALAQRLQNSTPADDIPPSASLRATLVSHMDKLEQQEQKVALRGESVSKRRNIEWLVAASLISATVLVALSLLWLPRSPSKDKSVATALQLAPQQSASPFVSFSPSEPSSDSISREAARQLQDGLAERHEGTQATQVAVDVGQKAQLDEQLMRAQQTLQELHDLQKRGRALNETREQLVTDLYSAEGLSIAADSQPTASHATLPIAPSPLTAGSESKRHEAERWYYYSATAGEPTSPPGGTVRGWRRVDPRWGDGDSDFSRPTHEQYDAIQENPFVVVGPETALSTFSIDVDSASYANVRRFLTHNTLPPPDAVRTEELVNYFQYDYPQPRDRHPFSVNMEVAGCPWKTDHLLLRIGLKGQNIDTSERPASNLVFLLDVSGSMQAENKLPLLRRAMKMLVGQLSENDQVTIVTYAGQAGLRLDTTSGDQRAEIEIAIDSLSAGGSTNGSAGIELAYEKAVQHFIEGGTNRIILATDGDLNVGISDDEQLVQLIKSKAESGVFLTVLGFGTGNLKDSKLEKLADNGNGMYGYIDSLREARKVLVEEMTGSLVTIAKDVKIQVEFNPAEVRSYRLIGYENRIMAAQDFHDDTKDAGEIGAGHTVTALYELEPAGQRLTGQAENAAAQARPLKYQQLAEPTVETSELTNAAETGELLTLSLRYKQPEGIESSLVEVPLDAKPHPFQAASDDFRFASSVAAFSMLLRGSQLCGDISFAAVEEWASNALGEDRHGRRTELVDLVRRAKQLRGE